jgi:hypothetical protein
MFNNPTKQLTDVFNKFIKTYKLEVVKDDIYIAGGAIRDVFQGVRPKDYDIYACTAKAADAINNALKRRYPVNNNGNFDFWSDEVGGKLNVIVNPEFIRPPEELIKEFNFTCNMNYFHRGVVRKHSDIGYKILNLNPGCKYPVGCLMKLPRMIELGYEVSELLMAQLLGKCLPLGIDTVEAFKKSCPGLSSSGGLSHATGLPTAKELFDKSQLGEALL